MSKLPVALYKSETLCMARKNCQNPRWPPIGVETKKASYLGNQHWTSSINPRGNI